MVVYHFTGIACPSANAKPYILAGIVLEINKGTQVLIHSPNAKHKRRQYRRYQPINRYRRYQFVLCAHVPWVSSLFFLWGSSLHRNLARAQNTQHPTPKSAPGNFTYWLLLLLMGQYSQKINKVDH